MNEEGKIMADWFKVNDEVLKDVWDMLKKIHEQNVIDELLFKA